MISPSVMFIEMGQDHLKSLPDWLKESQQKELTSFGDYRAREVGATGLSDDFRKGYELGLSTARAIIATSVAAMKGGASQDIL